MKSMNKTNFFTIFVAVVMAITTTSCLDPLDSADGMPDVSAVPHSSDPMILDLLCQTGELDIILDQFAFGLILRGKTLYALFN